MPLLDLIFHVALVSTVPRSSLSIYRIASIANETFSSKAMPLILRPHAPKAKRNIIDLYDMTLTIFQLVFHSKQVTFLR